MRLETIESLQKKKSKEQIKTIIPNLKNPKTKSLNWKI